jgi:hypothetical protein
MQGNCNSEHFYCRREADELSRLLERAEFLGFARSDLRDSLARIFSNFDFLGAEQQRSLIADLIRGTMDPGARETGREAGRSLVDHGTETSPTIPAAASSLIEEGRLDEITSTRIRIRAASTPTIRRRSHWHGRSRARAIRTLTGSSPSRSAWQEGVEETSETARARRTREISTASEQERGRAPRIRDQAV